MMNNWIPIGVNIYCKEKVLCTWFLKWFTLLKLIQSYIHEIVDFSRNYVELDAVLNAARCLKILQGTKRQDTLRMLQDAARYCNMLQDAARCCKMLQDAARCCKMLQDPARCCKMLQDATRCCKMSKDAERHCNILRNVKILHDFATFFCKKSNSSGCRHRAQIQYRTKISASVSHMVSVICSSPSKSALCPIWYRTTRNHPPYTNDDNDAPLCSLLSMPRCNCNTPFEKPFIWKWGFSKKGISKWLFSMFWISQVGNYIILS